MVSTAKVVETRKAAEEREEREDIEAHAGEQR